MGCDIHMYVERKVGGVWQQVSEEEGVRHPYWQESMNEESKKHFERKCWDPGRNYALFGLLAGIRSTIFSPFIMPRGIPEDLSEGVAAIWKEWDGDGHTPSFLTLPELLSFQDTIEDVPCFLDISQFKILKKTGKVPENYHYAPPPKIVPVSNEKMERIMNLAAFLDEREYWTKVEHKEPVKEISKAFFVDIIEAMKKLSENPEEVRCVFWFDN
jgi:hypothetical protein